MKIYRKFIFITRILLLLAISFFLINPSPKSNNVAISASANGSMLLGVYPEGYITQNTIDQELLSLDSWSGKRASIAAATFEIDDPNPQGTTFPQIELLWTNGLSPFINLKTGYFSNPTAAQLASGQYDTHFQRWAQAFAAWAGTEKWAFISLFPDMNLPWLNYGSDPTNYIAAFIRIQNIFLQNGVPQNSVRWVFSPSSSYAFTSYYPGDQYVNVVGFSAYNYGYCPADSTPSWDSPETVFHSSIATFRITAPTKPIFVTRTGTTDYDRSGHTSPEAKNQWLTDAYNYLASTLGVQAILYYNINNSWECNWAVYKPDGVQYPGYINGVSNPAFGYIPPEELGQMDLSPKIFTLFLPVAANNLETCGTQTPLLLSHYPQGWPGSQTTYDNEISPLNSWAQHKVSIIGTFIDFQAPDYSTHVTNQLLRIWENGYTPFINITSSKSARDIATGRIDSAIRSWARAYKVFATQGGNRKAFLAPLPEMNGSWVAYGRDATNFNIAYTRIQNIFTEEGVPSDSIWWTFAPNGAGSSFETYYPGDTSIDVLGFSSYNFGYFPGNSWPKWESPQEIYQPYLDRMRVMAPTKPIFIAQTGTTAYTQSGYSMDAKNQWLKDAYDYLADYPGVRGMVYFNIQNTGDYDFPFYVASNPAKQFDGYKEGAANPQYCYIAPGDLMARPLTP